MRVLLTGATGFIGRTLTRALAQRGHEVIGVSRHGAIRADFEDVPSRDWWVPQLAGIDAVINAVGILREGPGRSFDRLHAKAPAELFHACRLAGVQRVVQISALGADEHAQSRYHRSKKEADDVLRSMRLAASAIVQPSLVYGPGGTSAALFDRMAAAPLLPLPWGGRALVQPVHVDDLVEAVVNLVERRPEEAAQTIVCSGPQPLTFRDYLARLRKALGFASSLRVLAIPAAMFRFAASLAGRIPGSLLDGETAAMLLRGNAATDPAFARLLGHAPRPVESFVDDARRDSARQSALLGIWLPVLRASMALVWLWTGIVSLGLYPVEQSRALLARVGLHGAAATLCLYGAAMLDLALGVLTWLSPLRWRGAVWALQLLLIAGYTLLITLFLPEYWLHPYGPLTKNLPMMAAIALLWALEPARDRS